MLRLDAGGVAHAPVLQFVEVAIRWHCVIGPNGLFHDCCSHTHFRRVVGVGLVHETKMRPLLGSSHWGRESPFVTSPVLVVDCYLWETWDGRCTGSVTANKHAPVLQAG